MSERQLFMRLPGLGELPPEVSLPEGYQLGSVRPDDDSHRVELAEVLSQAFGDAWHPGRVAKVLSAQEGVQEIFVVSSPSGPVVATASARLVPVLYPTSGYVHFVGVHPRQRGRRLGEAVTRAVLAYFAARGMRDAVLETDDFRGAAIKTYLRLGFVPEYRAPSDQPRWSRVLQRIARHASASEIPDPLEGSV